jgi:opacity protein-like surface antigen
MTKWALAGAVALLVAGPAFAASPGSGPDQWSGLYLGAQAGYAMVDSAEYYKDGIPSDLHQHIAAEGATGGLFLGYNHIFSGSFLGGIEVEGNLHDLIGLHGTKAYGPYYRHDWSTAARLRFGFFPTADALLYLSAGAEVGNFDYDEGELRFGGNSNMNQTLTGLQLGLGVETSSAAMSAFVRRPCTHTTTPRRGWNRASSDSTRYERNRTFLRRGSGLPITQAGLAATRHPLRGTSPTPRGTGFMRAAKWE